MKVRDLIYRKRFKDPVNEFTLEDLPEDILKTDKIRFHAYEAWFSENESWDAFSEIEVFREREETPEEREKRKEETAKILESSKKERYQTFLKLKKEFEPEKPVD